MEKVKVVFITLECADPVFSGNGTYSRSLINSLVHHKEEVSVFVITASSLTPPATNTAFPKEWLESPNFSHHVISVPSSKWYRHDLNSCWEEFANGFDSDLLDTLKKFDPDIIAGVDWSALLPYQSVKRVLPTTPYVYLNFRVFHASSGISEQDKEIFKAKEYDSCLNSVQTITLSPFDTSSLITLTKDNPASSRIITLLPPLPRKIHSLALAYSPPPSVPSSPKYLLCCVRLSLEKNVEVFVDVCSQLSSFLTERNIVPYMCGAAQSKEYAETLREKLKKVHPPSIIVSEVLTHEALVEVYKNTALNFHPALYEAYGLTIVEAAAFGIPSIVNEGGGIGATALLKEQREVGEANKEVFSTNMGDATAVAEQVKSILLNEDNRVSVAARARTKSLSYGETENGEQFLKYLKTVPLRNSHKSCMVKV